MKDRWATVAVCMGFHHICVFMKEGETEAEVTARVEDSLWGKPARVVGIYDTPWNRGQKNDT